MDQCRRRGGGSVHEADRRFTDNTERTFAPDKQLREIEDATVESIE